ncbi:MAG: 16S rRNA (guanine(966)-N(2))-methyltransferase RsmD [Pseudomonadota bacterium]
MRIIAGQFRGLRLVSVGKGDSAAHLRPTPDRVRESLFNVLVSTCGDPVPGARVLDLFAGTGALGLEALSRGAEEAVFVENGAKSRKILQGNIEKTRTEDRTQVLAKDATRLGPAFFAADLVFLDPPYGKGLGEKALAAALAGGWIAPEAWIIWEESAPQEPPRGFERIDHRSYGETQLTILRALSGQDE